MATTWTKLKSGNWGVRGDAAIITAGATVIVAKKDGSTQSVQIDKVVWTDKKVALAAIVSSGSSSGSSTSGSSRPRSQSRTTRTGCSCGSVNEYSKDSDCWQCQHDAE